jgi:hypothetical protein
MCPTLEVKLRNQDNELLHRVLDVKLSSQQRLVTPARAIDARLASRNTDIDLAEAHLFECYTRSGASTVNDRMSTKEKEQDYSYYLNAIRRKAGAAPFLLFQEFFETSYPTEKQLQFLTRTAHSYSDIVALPLVSRITDRMKAGGEFEKYLEFVTSALECVDTYNRKPVMGIVPLKTPFLHIEELIGLYCKHDVLAFCLDFAASTPETARQSLEQVLFALAKEGTLKESYIHAINVSPGRPRTTKLVSSCQSILSYGYGVDSFGDLHRTRMIIKGPPPRPVPPRLFSRKDYGDHMTTTQAGMRGVAPEKTGVPLQRCAKEKDLARLFNSEQHSLETRVFPRLMDVSKGKSQIGDYLADKEYVEKDVLKHMKALGANVRKGRVQRRLL